MRRLACLSVFACLLAISGAQAQVDKFKITAEEQAACQPDAERLCLSSYPSEDRMLACMRANRKGLSATCAPVFEAGLKRRGLH